MGWIIGKGIGVPFRMGGGQSWSSYWSHQSEVLFFGLYSEISGGQMPNRVPGATDYLTVAGSAGSETYQCPNTAAYIAADTDYIWFKTDTTQRTTTTAELIGYDLQRTPVKYEDDAPNSIIAIMILKSGETITGSKLNKLYKDMWLPIEWQNNTNAYGHLKSNRIGQQLWTPEATYPLILNDGHTLGWYLSDEGIIKDGSDRVSAWNSKLTSNHLLQADGDKQPLWSANGVLFNGIDEMLKVAIATLDQPTSVYMVLRQKTWVANNILFDGAGVSSGWLQQRTATPGFRFNAGASSTVNSNLALDTFGILRIVINGASSKLQVNNTAATTGNFGSSNMEGVTLGGDPSETYHGNVEFKECIYRDIADEVLDETTIYNYLATKYGLATI